MIAETWWHVIFLLYLFLYQKFSQQSPNCFTYTNPSATSLPHLYLPVLLLPTPPHMYLPTCALKSPITTPILLSIPFLIPIQTLHIPILQQPTWSASSKSPSLSYLSFCHSLSLSLPQVSLNHPSNSIPSSLVTQYINSFIRACMPVSLVYGFVVLLHTLELAPTAGDLTLAEWRTRAYGSVACPSTRIIR